MTLCEYLLCSFLIEGTNSFVFVFVVVVDDNVVVDDDDGYDDDVSLNLVNRGGGLGSVSERGRYADKIYLALELVV